MAHAKDDDDDGWEDDEDEDYIECIDDMTRPFLEPMG
jgi:hypothetical protein